MRSAEWYEDGKTPTGCGLHGEEEHDIELFEMNQREGYDVWMCMICGLQMKMPRDLKPEDAA